MMADDAVLDFFGDGKEDILSDIDISGEKSVIEERFERMVEFSPEMSAYRQELRKVLHALNTIGAQGIVFDNVLLVSIDEGWGYSELVEMINKELRTAFGLKHYEIQVEEEKYPTNQGVDTWIRQYERVEKIALRARKGGKFAILKYDLSDAVSKLSNPAFIRNICKLKEYAKDTVLIFRVPYMEKKALAVYERTLADLMPIRVLAIPPVSVENMVIYLRERIQRLGICIEDACDDLLEQWICQEKSEGVFQGYQTLEKMITEILYQKALEADDKDEHKSMARIVKADVQRMLTYPIETENAYELLNELIGLTQLKSSIREMVAQIKLQKELEEQGKDIEKPSLHMLFLGNPGTGKTTVARIIGQIFKQEGLLRKGHFIETTGGNLIVGNVNTIMENIRTTCRDSYGSVLFIDEAYGMSVGHSRGNVADEILPTLVAEMENHRDDMCVILAGYKDEMDEFLKANSGLRSRLPHILEFPNYTRDELIEIFFRMLEGRFAYEEELKETLCDYIQNIPADSLNTKEFSNARFIRNLYERLWGKAAYRISQSREKEIVLKKEDMVCVIEEEDFQTMVQEKPKKEIGFIVKRNF